MYLFMLVLIPNVINFVEAYSIDNFQNKIEIISHYYSFECIQ